MPAGLPGLLAAAGRTAADESATRCSSQHGPAKSHENFTRCHCGGSSGNISLRRRSISKSAERCREALPRPPGAGNAAMAPASSKIDVPAFPAIRRPGPGPSGFQVARAGTRRLDRRPAAGSNRSTVPIHPTLVVMGPLVAGTVRVDQNAMNDRVKPAAGSTMTYGVYRTSLIGRRKTGRRRNAACR